MEIPIRLTKESLTYIVNKIKKLIPKDTKDLTNGAGFITSLGDLQKVETATKAQQDSKGQVIDSTYIKSVTSNNAILTMTKGDGTTSTTTVNNVTHATNADNSTKATQDSDGKAINTTYLKKNNDSASGLTCVNDTFGSQLTIKRNSTNAATVKFTNSGNTNNYVGFTGTDKTMYKWGDSGANQTAFLDASNYNNYAPTKTGSGASGTWGINISGNATTATKATQDSAGRAINSTYLLRNQTIQNDMNACVTEGIYRFSGNLTNGWTSQSWGTLLVFNNGITASSGAAGTYLVQLAFPTDNRIYQRQRVNTGAWSSWSKLVVSTDVIAKATGDKNGLQIDTGYLKLSGGTVTGATTFKGHILLASGIEIW